MAWGQAFAPFCASPFQNHSSLFGCHTRAKPVRLSPAPVIRLKCSFSHDSSLNSRTSYLSDNLGVKFVKAAKPTLLTKTRTLFAISRHCITTRKIKLGSKNHSKKFSKKSVDFPCKESTDLLLSRLFDNQVATVSLYKSNT